ncbi:unnamed protein product [Closterium sp. NIES-53]
MSLVSSALLSLTLLLSPLLRLPSFDFAAAFPLDYATALVAESESASPPSVGGEFALGTDVLEDRQEDIECLAARVPHLVAMLLAPKGNPDAPDIPTPRSYAEAITGPYSSQWQTTMDAEMASWKSTGTYVDAVAPSGANIVDGMWIFRGVDDFQTFSPTPKMTTFRVLLHIAAQCHYDHSLSAPPSDESIEPSGLYPELVGCLMYLMMCTQPDLAYPLSFLAHYVAPGRHQKVHWDAAKGVLRYLCTTSVMGLVLGGRGRVVLTGHAYASWVDDLATQRSSQGYTFSLGSGCQNACAPPLTACLPPPFCCLPCSLRCPASARPACCATMASLHVLAFNHEGQSIQFDTWLDDLQLYLLSDYRDSVSLFHHTSGAAPAPPATADTQALYDAVVVRYSSPATAALGRLLLPYLFPELSAFATLEDLVSHLRTSDARYRAALPAEFLVRNQPLVFITLYFIVTRLLDSLRSVRDHFLSLDSTVLTVDLLEQHLLAAETSVVTVGAARGTPRTPFSEGCSPSPLAHSYASAAAADVPSTHTIALPPSSVPLRVPLSPPPESSLPTVPDPESDLAHVVSPTVSRLLAIVVTDPSFESTVTSTLVAELVDFAAVCRLDYATALVAESESANPPSVGGECALGTDVLK